MELKSNSYQFYIKKFYSKSKNNIISKKLNWSKNYCLFSLKQRFSIAVNYLLSPFFMLFCFPYAGTQRS